MPQPLYILHVFFVRCLFKGSVYSRGAFITLSSAGDTNNHHRGQPALSLRLQTMPKKVLFAGLEEDGDDLGEDEWTINRFKKRVTSYGMITCSHAQLASSSCNIFTT